MNALRVATAFSVVALAACAPHAHRLAPIEGKPEWPALPMLYDVMVPKRDTPGGKVLGQTQCGSMMFMQERRGTSTYVTDLRETFWVDDADLARAPAAYVHCRGPLVMRTNRVSAQLAHALTPPVLAESDADSSLAGDFPHSIYQRDDDDTSCIEFVFGDERLSAKAGANISWGFARESAREIRLTGPNINGVEYLCLRDLFMTKRTPDAWDLVERPSYEKGAIWAYAPASAVRWFASRAACEKGLPRRKGPIATIPFRGCG